eukprot:CAMPEP_0167797000 /NCGR_PEP_ID=MMETSP0111_2-20121227/15389_1 /TAXON_ID=91324 /ORGANISM="Lotharella globosa, Strain CCCM811" /LENGTH=344 /DNA_ID=CAMNT_0007691013 /DNA_START=1 /DNA_END=1035 /DNA_ORIENTATION=-
MGVWDVELEGIRANIKKDLMRFDALLGARQESLRRREALLGALVPGEPTHKRKATMPAHLKHPQDPLRTVGKSIGSDIDHAVTIAKLKSKELEGKESRLQVISATPMFRIKLVDQLESLSPYQVKAMLASYILEERVLDVSSAYKLMAANVLPHTELRASLFTRWMENAVGDIFPPNLVRIIYEYHAQSPKGVEFKLELSSLYPSIANSYASVVDGKHGYPGAATNRGASQYIQAVFPEDVFATKVTLSQPRFGVYAEQGWPTEGNYLHAHMVIEIPKSQDAYEADSKTCEWVTVGRVRSDEELENGAIEVPLELPEGHARVFRLWNEDRSLNTYVVTGTFELE